MKNAAKSTTKTRRKPASSSTRSRRQNNVPKNSVVGGDSTDAAELDAIVDCPESTALESQESGSVLEETGNDSRVGGDAVSALSNELMAITLHQPWASLIAEGKKHYETRSWGTDYRGLIAIHAAKKMHEDESLISFLDLHSNQIPLGAIVAIAELTDCVQMTEEFIDRQPSFEVYLGLWEPGRYAWKLENVQSIDPPISAVGKQGLWKWNRTAAGKDTKPGSGNNYEQLSLWKDSDIDDVSWKEKDWKESVAKQLKVGDRIVENLNNPDWGKTVDSLIRYGEIISDIYPGKYEPLALVKIRWDDGTESETQVRLLEKVCNNSMTGNGSTCAAASVPDSPLLESNCGDVDPTSSVNGTVTVSRSLKSDSLEQSSLPTSNLSTLPAKLPSPIDQKLSQLQVPASHSAKTESDSDRRTIETVSPTCCELSENCSPDSPSLKTSPDFLTVPTPPATNPEVTSATSSIPYRQTGTMRNGLVSGATNSALRGVDKGYLLLRSPGALSTGNGRPPGKTRLESQLQELNLISASEVAAPEFLEAGYQLPIGFSNPSEQRTALELAQVQAQQSSIAPSSELPAKIQTTAIAVQPSATPWTGELQPSDLNESNTLIVLPANIGSLSKDELLTGAIEQHELISSIERAEFQLGIEKLHRARLTGIYFQEFKKRCRHGEFETELEANGIKPRRAQQYMSIAKNWQAIEAEAKAQTVALLVEENQSFGIKWALDTIASQKKALKSAAAPSDPDCWRTPNTADQPIVDLVKQALGGQIWCDPCAGALTKNVPAAVRYFKTDDGLLESNIWSRTAFINPPFSDPFPWVKKCCLSIARGNLSAAVMLLKAGTVSNIGTGELISKYASAVCHWRGRINFLNDEGNVVKGSDFDCVFIYFGDRLDLFRQAFGQRGTISTIDNHYSSINKKYFDTEAVAEAATEQSFNSTKQEEKQFAAAVGLRNGKSVLPDTRDRDREQMEQHDPNTVQTLLSQQIPTKTDLAEEESESPDSEVSLLGKTNSYSTNQQVKEAYLNDYITAVSSNLKAFSSEQIAFLYAAIASEMRRRGMELRIDFER